MLKSITKTKNYFMAFLFFTIFWLAFLGFSGTLTSGFHLTDDHEIVRINNDSKSESTLAVAGKWMKNDQFGTHRFRPFYIFHRALETKVFGTNFTAWSVYTAILAIATSFFLFCFLYLLKFSFWESLLFSLMTLIGQQMSIWWRLGPQESLGMFFLSAALLFLGLHIVKQKHEKIFKILFVVFAILTALSKESFLLILPTFIVLLLYLSCEENGITLKESIRKNIASIAVLSAFFVGLLLYVKYVVGTGGVGYAGIDGFNLKSYLMAFLQVARNDWYSIIFLIQIVLVTIYWTRKTREEKKKMLKSYVFPAIIFLTISVPQVILYAKSGFFERYLVPATLAYSLAIVFLLRQIRKDNKKIWTIIISSLLLLACGYLQSEIKSAQDFTQSGRDIGGIFNVIKTKTSLDANLLIVCEPAIYPEWSESINYYIKYELERKNLFVYVLQKKQSYSDSQKQYTRVFVDTIYGQNTHENIVDKKTIDAIILLPRMEKIFLENFSNKDFPENYLRQDFGGYVVYHKPKS